MNSKNRVPREYGHRRDFLKRAAVVSFYAATGDGMSAATAQAKLAPVNRAGGPRLKIALNAYSFSKLLNDDVKDRGSGISLFQLIDFCARHEFDGLDATGYFFPGYPQAPASAYVSDFKRRAFNSGIDISGTGVRNNFTTADKAIRADSVRHIREWVEVAARLGAPVLRVFADTQMRGQSWETVSGGAPREDVEEWIAADIRECAEHGKEFGVIIGVQNHGDFLKTSAEHLSLIERVDSEWCGAIVDTGYYKSKDPYDDMARVAPYAVNWQIKESPFGAGSEIRTDLKKLLVAIRLAGYRGYLPIETLSVPGKDYDPFTLVPKFLAELREAVEATASIAPPTRDESSPAEPLRPASDPKTKSGVGK
jgi:sugar phosphate isomerase/epimerase